MTIEIRWMLNSSLNLPTTAGYSSLEEQRASLHRLLPKPGVRELRAYKYDTGEHPVPPTLYST